MGIKKQLKTITKDKRVVVLTLILFSLSIYYYYRCICLIAFGSCGNDFLNKDFLCNAMNNIPSAIIFGLPALIFGGFGYFIFRSLYSIGLIFLLLPYYLISVIFFAILDSAFNFVKKRKK